MKNQIEDLNLLTAVTEKSKEEINNVLTSKEVSKEIKECINNHLAKGISIKALNEKAEFILQLLQNKKSRPEAKDLMEDPYLKS